VYDGAPSNEPGEIVPGEVPASSDAITPLASFKPQCNNAPDTGLDAIVVVVEVDVLVVDELDVELVTSDVLAVVVTSTPVVGEEPVVVGPLTVVEVSTKLVVGLPVVVEVVVVVSPVCAEADNGIVKSINVNATKVHSERPDLYIIVRPLLESL
jgi:hypothetical protein